MKKKGMIQQIFYYIFAVVLIALIFAFGYQQITRLQNLNEQAKFITFKTDFQNAVNNIYYKNPGSTSVYSSNSANKPLTLPQDSKKVCVKKLNEKSSQVNSDSKYSTPFNIDNLVPETQEKCFSLASSKFSFTLENKVVNREALVYIK